MTEGWTEAGTSWLPVAVQRRQAQEAAAEARQAKADQAEREQRAEERHQENLTLFREQAEARGQVVDVMAMARGEVRGRSVQDVFAEALAKSAAEDRREAARVYREGHGEPERLHVEVGEPVIHHARSETGRAIWRRAERFRAVLAARRKLAEAERAAERSRDDIGYVCEAPRRPDPVAVVTARAEARNDGLRIRSSGYITDVY